MYMHILSILTLCISVLGHLPEPHLDISRTVSDVITTDVLIIGAGISGLEAARLLEKNGIKTMILEARERTGGRIHSIRSQNGHMLDLGAGWIHGIHGSIPNGLLTNPLWDLTQEAKIETRGTEHDDYSVFDLINDEKFDVQRWYHDYIVFVREKTRDALPNLSLKHYAILFVRENDLTEKEQYVFYSYLNYVIENTEAAELDTIGAKGLLDITSTHYGEEHIFHQTGFIAVTDYLAKDVSDIRLGQIVTRITYDKDSVEVVTKHGQVYRAAFVILTVPLGVLKAKEIEFSPHLPSWKLGAIDRLGFGVMEKAILIWNEAWWNSTNFYFLRISSKPTEFGYWINANKWNDKPALICFFSGKTPSYFQSNEERVVEEIRQTLQEMFPDLIVPLPSESYLTHWNTDPFAYGAYSYISVKQRYEDPSYLAEPIGNRLLFAGEATNIDTYGYAHGALLSARREVTRLLYVYDLLPKDNLITSRSSMITPFKVCVLLLLHFFLY